MSLRLGMLAVDGVGAQVIPVWHQIRVWQQIEADSTIFRRMTGSRTRTERSQGHSQAFIRLP